MLQQIVLQLPGELLGELAAATVMWLVLSGFREIRKPDKTKEKEIDALAFLRQVTLSEEDQKILRQMAEKYKKD
jgi:hypothetical protein